MPEPHPDTRQRLLDHAEQLFAEHGYDAVSIRDLCQAAGVNLAAVNYHFGGKEALYGEVIERLMTAKRDRFLAVIASQRPDAEGDLESLLGAFFRTHFEDALSSPRGAAFIKLLVREIHHGEPERIASIRALLAPLWQELARSLLVVAPWLDARSAAWVVGSLHGQLVHFTMRWHVVPAAPATPRPAGEFMQALFPPLADDVDTYIDAAVAHITRFSAAGIRALAPRAGSTSPRKDRP